MREDVKDRNWMALPENLLCLEPALMIYGIIGRSDLWGVDYCGIVYENEGHFPRWTAMAPIRLVQ